jgi:hypothetical protein
MTRKAWMIRMSVPLFTSAYPVYGGKPSPASKAEYVLFKAGVPAIAPASAGRRLEARGVEPLFPAAMSNDVHGCFIRAISEVKSL